MKQFDYVPSLSDWLGTLNWNSGRFIWSACGTTFTQMRLGDGPAGSHPDHAFPQTAGYHWAPKDIKAASFEFRRRSRSQQDTRGHATKTVRDRASSTMRRLNAARAVRDT